MGGELDSKGEKRMQFGTFAGNMAAKKQLSAAIDAGHYPHALLLEGEVGSGRRMLAMQIARAAVCTAPDGRPCGRCAGCIKTVHPDITVRDGRDRAIGVDDIRTLRQEAFVFPNEAAHRVIILADAQTMTPQAQNALLKILEEPPAHVLFILTCENRTQLLETVRSRCVCVALQPVAWEEAYPVLREQLPQLPEDALMQAHQLFGGRIGQIIAGVQDGIYRQVLDLLPPLAEAIVAPTELPLLQLTGRLEKDKELTDGVLAGLRLVIRDALVIQSGATALISTAPQQARLLAGRLSGARLAALLTAAEQLENDRRRNMNHTLFLTRLCACLRQAAGN